MERANDDNVVQTFAREARRINGRASFTTMRLSLTRYAALSTPLSPAWATP
jgi:hypothetical protein